MSRELLLENFDRILAAPCAIPRLRQFIYALALRGELTSQDAADTPSEDILRWQSCGNIRLFLCKRIQRCDKDEATRTSAALPSSWQSVCVEEIAELRSGIAIEQHLLSDKGSIPYVKVSDLSIEPNADEVVTSSRFAGPEFKNQCIEAGSLIFPKRGGAIATNRKKVAAVDLLCDSNLMTLKPRIPEDHLTCSCGFAALICGSLTPGLPFRRLTTRIYTRLPCRFPLLRSRRGLFA